MWVHTQCLVAEALLALVKNVLLDATGLRDGDHVGLVLLANGEDVANTGGEDAALGVTHIDNVESTRVLVAGGDDTNTAVILTLGDNARDTSLELDNVGHLARGEVDLDDIIDTDERIWVADGTTVVGGDVWDSLGAECQLVDTAKLEVSLVLELLVVQAVEHVTSLNVEKHTEVLVSLVEGDNIVEATWEVWVGAHTAVDLDKAEHANLLALLLGQGVLETVPEDKAQRKALTELVRSGGWAWCPGATHLVEHPVLWGIKPLHMFLWPARRS